MSGNLVRYRSLSTDSDVHRWQSVSWHGRAKLWHSFSVLALSLRSLQVSSLLRETLSRLRLTHARLIIRVTLRRARDRFGGDGPVSHG